MCGLWPTSPWAQGTPGPGSIPRLPPLCVQGQPVACLRRLLGWLAPTSALGPPGSAEEEAVRVEQVRACARVRGSKDAYDLVINKTQLHSLGALSLGGACWGGGGGGATRAGQLQGPASGWFIPIPASYCCCSWAGVCYRHLSMLRALALHHPRAGIVLRRHAAGAVRLPAQRL